MKPKEAKRFIEPKKKIKRTLTYKIELDFYTDGTSCMKREVTGFENTYEVLGLAAFIQCEIVKMMSEDIKPNNVTINIK
jgi:hypothetical protein